MTGDPQARIWKRLEELLALRPGWLDGEGVTPEAGVIAYAARVAEATATWAGPVSIYPTPEGGIELEWSDNHDHHSITIGPDLRLTLDTTEKASSK